MSRFPEVTFILCVANLLSHYYSAYIRQKIVRGGLRSSRQYEGGSNSRSRIVVHEINLLPTLTVVISPYDFISL